MMDASTFMTTSLQATAGGEKIGRILAAALEAVEPGRAIEKQLQRTDDRLEIQGRTYDLSTFRRVFLIGAGKAGAPMASAVAAMLDEHLSGGVVVVKEGHRDPFPTSESIQIIEAGHPVPDKRGIRGTEQIIELLEGAQKEDLVICLLSGGGSALMVAPVDGVTLEDLQDLTAALLGSGASIDEINAIRKHLDRIKGGKLAQLAWPAQVLNLILSDVVGDPLDVIASGPTVPDQSSFEDAWRVLVKYRLIEKAPPAVVEALKRGRRGELAENPKTGDPVFNKVHNCIIASNQHAAQAALERAKAEGFRATLLTTYLQGEARQVGRVMAAIARQIERDGQPVERPACLVLGGETTVTLQGEGLGGRNQELALGSVADLAGLDGTVLVSLATDGGDGPTDAAGAVVSGDTWQRAIKAGLDPFDFLSRNDSYHFFDRLGDLIKTGPTQTNVNDLAFIFAL